MLTDSLGQYSLTEVDGGTVRVELISHCSDSAHLVRRAESRIDFDLTPKRVPLSHDRTVVPECGPGVARDSGRAR